MIPIAIAPAEIETYNGRSELTCTIQSIQFIPAIAGKPINLAASIETNETTIETAPVAITNGIVGRIKTLDEILNNERCLN